MGLLEFTVAPVDLNKKTKSPIKTRMPKSGRLKVKNINPATRRRVASDATVFGDELFQLAYKPAKAIVVKFYPYTLNLLRIDVEGRFAIQYFKADDKAKGIQGDKFLLYRFFNPIQYEYKEEAFQIELSANVKTYGPFEHVDSIRDKILEILRRQLLEDREKDKQFAIDEEKAEKLAKEKAQDEAEKLTEQLAATRISRNSESGIGETKIKSEESPQEKIISQEVGKEENSNELPSNKIRKPTASFFTEISTLNPQDSNKFDETNFEGKTVENSIPDFAEKLVMIMKKENNQVKFITKMSKSKAIAWIKDKANFYIVEK